MYDIEIGHQTCIDRAEEIAYVIRESHNAAVGVDFDNTDITENYILGLLNEEKNICIIANASGKIVGTSFLCVENRKTWCFSGLIYYFRNVAVLPEYQGQHIASKMVKYAVEQCKNSPYQGIMLATPENNKKAIVLYKHLGFEIFDVFAIGKKKCVRMAYWKSKQYSSIRKSARVLIKTVLISLKNR